MDQTHATLMDKNFRYMKYVYDISRPFFLAGRAALRRKIRDLRPNHVLEIGCGTGRNLICLAKKLPETKFTGIDISSEMIGYAQTQVQKTGMGNRITLQTMELADYLMQDDTIPAQVIFFSYSLSMIPDWKNVLRETGAYCEQHGTKVVIADFHDMNLWPDFVRKRIHKNMSYFNVSPCIDCIDFIKSENIFPSSGSSLRSFFGGYSFLYTSG